MTTTLNKFWEKFHTKTTQTKRSVEGVGVDMDFSIYSIHPQLLIQIDQNLIDLSPECSSQLALSVNIQFKGFAGKNTNGPIWGFMQPRHLSSDVANE